MSRRKRPRKPADVVAPPMPRDNVKDAILKLAMAQCDDEQIVAYLVARREMEPDAARAQVEMYAPVMLPMYRDAGKAELLEAQYQVAMQVEDSRSAGAMLQWLGQQHLDQVPGGTAKEFVKLLDQLRGKSPEHLAAMARRAFG